MAKHKAVVRWICRVRQSGDIELNRTKLSCQADSLDCWIHDRRSNRHHSAHGRAKIIRTYGSSGVGGSVQLAGELLKMKANLSMVHVPYKSSVDSARATASGEVELSFPGIPGALPFLYANKIKALAVTSMKRVAMMASTPTLNESGVPGYDRYGSYGVLAPLGAPKDVVARLNAAISDVVNVPEMKGALNQQGLEPQTNTPEQFATFIQGEIAENAKLIKLIGLKAE